MNAVDKISVTENVTLISLNDSPADFKIVAQIFDMLSKAGIDVDMISQNPPQGKTQNLSFTVKDEDLVKVFETASKLRELYPELKLAISSGNTKISVLDEKMRNCPGVAAKVFTAIAETDAEIRMITTSEVDISVLVYSHDGDSVYSALKSEF